MKPIHWYWAATCVLAVVVTRGSFATQLFCAAVAALLGAAAVMVGTRRHVAARRRSWWTLSAAYGLIGFGLGAAFVHMQLSDGPDPGAWLVRGPYLLGYLLLLPAFIGVARAASLRRDLGVMTDIGIVAVALVPTLHELVFAPVLRDTGLSSTGRMLVLAYALIDICVIFVVSRLLFGGVRRTPAVWLLVAGMALAAVTNVVTMAASGPAAYMLAAVAFIVSTALVGTAGLTPSIAHLDTPPPDGPPHLGRTRLTSIGAALFLPPVAAAVAGINPLAPTVLVPSAVVVALVVARLHGLFEGMRVASAEVQQREDYFRELVANLPDSLIVTDVDGVILDGFNKKVPLTERIGMSLVKVMRGERQRLFAGWLSAALANEHQETKEVRGRVAIPARRPGADDLDYEVVVRSMLDVEAVKGVVWMFRDVTERAFFERQLEHQALHDALTGLPNRTLFADRLVQARARRGSGGVAVLFIDLDNFKTINDSLGHDAGDTLLCSVAQRLRAALREEDTVARLGGDEFAVLVELTSRYDDGSAIGRRILDSLAAPFTLGERRVAVTASVGAATTTGQESADLLGQADVAMYNAKSAGKNSVVVFQDGMQTLASERLELAMELVDALDRNQLHIAYQPIVDLGSDDVVGFEALLRWAHPTRGIIPPLAFIPSAEENGLIVPIGRFVLREACREAQRWSEEYGRPLKMSVNLSARQLESETLIDDVRAALADSGLPPQQLILELTETVLVRNIEHSTARLTELKGLGVRLAIDDFGTGYSSLSYLRQFPVDVLKIDRSFIASMVSSAQATAVVRALVDMGTALHLETLAEGVEEESQVERLRAEHCGFAQGFLFAPPMPPAAVEELLKQQSSAVGILRFQ